MPLTPGGTYRGRPALGITDEEVSEGKVLPICLAEIHRIRSYFIGMFGERYSWVPDEISEDIIEQTTDCH